MAFSQAEHQTSPDRCRRWVADAGEIAVKQALRQLLSDLSAILFLVAYAVSGSLFVAVGIAVTAGLAPVSD